MITFLVGLAGLVYLLGGLVVGLRLLFAGFAFGSVATIVGQLPRQLVVTTALLEVALPAAVVGLVAMMVAGVRPLWRGLSWIRRKLPVSGDFALVLLAIVLMAPAFVKTKGEFAPWAIGISGVALTFTIASFGWPLFKDSDAEEKATPVIVRAAVVFASFAVIALTPSLLFASSLPFEDAQVCTTTATEPVEGKLIGEGGGQVLLEETEAGEQWVVNLPTAQITKSEYGEITARYACKEPSEEEKRAALEAEKKAEEEVGEHGGPTELRLASALRPYLYFDRKERWRPLAVEAFARERFDRRIRHRLCTQKKATSCVNLANVAQLKPEAATPTWIDIHGSGANGKDFESPYRRCHVGLAVDCNGGKGAAIYYRRSAHEGSWYWDFWWFYRYNDYNGHFNECRFYCDDHEGDWEGMVVITTESLEPEITGAIYAAHRDRIFVPGTTLPTSEGHPLAYVAEGTHATYPFVCAEECEQYSGLYEQHLPEGDHGGQIPWDDNVDTVCEADTCVRALPGPPQAGRQKLPYADSWAAWPGHWGASCKGGCGRPDASTNISPASPGFQTRFRCPWVANLKALPEGDEGLLSGERRVGGWEREQLACVVERAHG